jgi:hypothetical protein
MPVQTKHKMNRIKLVSGAAVVLMTLGSGLHVCGADESASSARPQTPPELREQLRNLPSEEREAKLKEWREKRRAEMEKRREEWKDLPPQEREAKLKEWRERQSEGLPRPEELERRREEFRNLSPEERQRRMRELQEQRRAERPEVKGVTLEERQAKRKEMRARLDKQITELRKKKTDGTITEVEQRRLDHMEVLARRFEQNGLGLRVAPPQTNPNQP